MNQMQSWFCVVRKHKIKKSVRSGWIVSVKGNGRDVAVFDGEVHICECDREIYQGRPTPWFEGTHEQFLNLLKEDHKSHAA